MATSGHPQPMANLASQAKRVGDGDGQWWWQQHLDYGLLVPFLTIFFLLSQGAVLERVRKKLEGDFESQSQGFRLASKSQQGINQKIAPNQIKFLHQGLHFGLLKQLKTKSSSCCLMFILILSYLIMLVQIMFSLDVQFLL